MQTTMTGPKPEVRGARAAEVAWRGIEHCREGDWHEGLYWLGMASSCDRRGVAGELPSLYYAYLGYGVARYQGQKRQGLRLCRHALERELYQPESYQYLARTHLLLGDRRSALDVVERGLEVDPSHPDLLALRVELGRRQSPMVPFLSRANALNRALGRLRHRLTGSAGSDRRGGG